MSVKKYKFVSPGIFVKEIDNSQLPSTPAPIGPVVIGQTARGPAMRPVTVNSFSEFVEIFGAPHPGTSTGDVYRDGTPTCPTYASYAAQAWLRNNSPITVVRLLGTQHNDVATDAAGEAGWKTTQEIPDRTAALAGGAYGLFLIASSSTDGGAAANTTRNDSPKTGSLAAVWYCNTNNAILLTGSVRGTFDAATASMNTLIQSEGSNLKFTAAVLSSTTDAAVSEKITFNFDKNSPHYIRKVFNTNPTLTNAGFGAGATKGYWLGETYDRFLTQGDGGVSDFGGVPTSEGAGGVFGFIAPLTNGTTTMANKKFGHKQAQTGWVFSQDLGGYSEWDAVSKKTKLFKFHTRKAGMYEMHNLKISIQDLRASTSDADPYSTFTVVVRRLTDTDAKIQEVERYSNLSLNPNSPNYIARRIGDRYVEFDSTTRRNKEYGKFINNSEFIRVEMDQDVDMVGPPDPSCVPFGFVSPPRFKGFSIMSGNAGFSAFGASLNDSADLGDAAHVSPRADDRSYGDFDSAEESGDGSAVRTQPNEDVGIACYTGSFLFPTVPLRVSSSDEGLSKNSMAYHGFVTTRTTASHVFDESIRDILRGLPDTINTETHATTLSESSVEFPFHFTLDDVHSGSTSTSETRHAYASGSRQRGHSITADTSGYTKGSVTKTGWEAAVLYGADKFTLPLFGGFHGLDITEADPFNNADLDGQTETGWAPYNTIKQAIDIVRDPEEYEFNLAVIPNLQEDTLTQHLINTCEDRADALAIIDLEGDFKPAAESTAIYQNRIGDVDLTVSNLQTRQINSSYACAYFPYVQMYDRENDAFVYIPPSIVALGTMSNSENKSELWFAPAGFNRGGLSNGAAGVPIVDTTLKLTKEDRDKLYEANVNPIASFPSEGLVVFGQKTLQATPSALDRINVRRLMIFLKKEISRFAAGILFDQNVQATWNRFTGKVEPFLRSVQTRFGLTEYKLVLDSTTTTDDLIDRNILYAKVFLKPARAIEYIAIDFNITNTGAAFDD